MTGNVDAISPLASIHPSTRVWRFSTVREHSRVGADCTIGQGCYIGPGVIVGNRVKIQNYALLYEPCQIESDAFIGPGVILANDRNPRAVTVEGNPKTPEDWRAQGVTIRRGASIGAGSILVPPLEIGEWAMIGAGSVVLSDVPKYGLFAGNPARQIGWVGKAGFRLEKVGSRFLCPETGEDYGELRVKG